MATTLQPQVRTGEQQGLAGGGVQQVLTGAQHGFAVTQHGLAGSQHGLGAICTFQITFRAQGWQTGLQTSNSILQQGSGVLTQQLFRLKTRSKTPASAELTEIKVATATRE